MHEKPIPIGINGLGQLGVSLLFLAAGSNDIHVVAANERGAYSVDELASEFRWDGVRGMRPELIRTKGRNLIINGRSTAISQEIDPDRIPWADLGAQIVIEATGKFRTGDEAARHLIGGAQRVIISSPSADRNVKTIVAGINQERYEPDQDTVISGGSCGLQGLSWLIRGVQSAGYGIEEDSVTVHCTRPYLNIQQVQYTPGRRHHPALAQAAGYNIVPHDYGIGNLLEEVMPELGVVSEDSNIVPVPQGLSIVLHGNLTEPTTKEELNERIRLAIEGNEKLKSRLGYETMRGMVSSMVWGRTNASVLDAPLTAVRGGKRFKLKGWLDTQRGYGSGLLDLIRFVGGDGH